MAKRSNVSESALIIIIFNLGGKLLGFIREILIASKFGSGFETDAFFIALAATGLIIGFIKDAINTTFIPILSEIEAKEGKKGKIKHTNNMINVIAVISILLMVISFVFAPFLVQVLAKGFEKEQLELTINLTRIGLPMILIYGIIGVSTGYLQSEQKFVSSAAGGISSNIVHIFFLVFLSSIFGVKGLMVSAVIAVLAQLVAQIPEALLTGYTYEKIFNLKDKYIQKVLVLSLPVFVGVAANDLNAIVDKTLASSLKSGSISALNYANKLNGLIIGVFVMAIITVIFPVLSEKSNSGNIIGMKKIMNKGINLLLIITVPATVGLIIFSTPIVEIAFQRGEFDVLATTMTSSSLKFYALGIVAMGVNLLLSKVYYSIQDTKTPMVIGIIAVVLNIILNLILVRYMAHSGLALATSLSIMIATLLSFYGLNKKIGALGTRDYIITFLKVGSSSILMGSVSYLIYNGIHQLLGISTVSNIIALLSAVSVGVLFYGIFCYILNVKEIRKLFLNIKQRLQ